MDYTRLDLVPVDSWTMKKCGSKQAETAGMDKCQVSIVLACTLPSNLLLLATGLKADQP